MSSIDPKPAAGVLGSFLATLVVGLFNRYTSYAPTVEETGAIVGLFGFACAWLIPRYFGGAPTVYIAEATTNEENV